MYKFITLFIVITVFSACGPKVDPTLKAEYESFSSSLQRTSLNAEQTNAKAMSMVVDPSNQEANALVSSVRYKSHRISVDISKSLEASNALFLQYSEGKISEEAYKESFRKIKDNMSGAEEDVQRLGDYLTGQKVGGN